jgi:hypothetical protein
VASELLEALYIVKENGMLLFSQLKNNKDHKADDLMAPFLAAIEMFSTTNLREKIHYIALLDGRKIYFKDMELSGSKKMLRFIAITEDRFTDFKGLDNKIIELTWQLRKWENFLKDEGTALPKHVYAAIQEKVQAMFNL